MALKQITAKDFKDAVSSLTNGYTCWHKLLGRTDAGTELVFVIGWSDAGYDEDDAKQNGYADGRYTICSKIACQSRYNGSQSDYDGDFEMPYDKETGDVWDTDTMVSNNESDWETDAATYNKDAQDIWDTYCVPNEDGFTALDALFESKKSSEAKKHTCSMQKKKESLAKKSEADYGAMTWTVTVEFDDNGKSVRKDYVVKAHNRDSAIDQAKLKPQHTNPDAKNIKVTYCKLGESLVKNHTCSMQKKKESLSAKKSEAYGDFNISDEDVKLTVNYVDVDSHGGSFSVDTPKDGQSYSLQEMKDMVKGMCEDCSGYADISRDGSDILIVVMAPETDENGEFANDYYAAYTVRCTVRIISTSLETFVDYLDKYNAE